MTKKLIITIAVALVLPLLFIAQARAQKTPAFVKTTYLPDPYGQVPGAPIGATYASTHDDFVSFSADLLAQTDPTVSNPQQSIFKQSVGTGKLDLLIYSGAGGQDNDPVQGGYQFPDSLHSPSGNPNTVFNGTWGHTGEFSPATVDNILGYLHTFDPNLHTPVFIFDMNQGGNSTGIQVTGQAYIWDPNAGPNGGIADGGAAFWAFDDGPDDNLFEPEGWVDALSTIQVGPYSLKHNVGSGKPDFIAYAPTMDLSQYAGKGLEFRTDFNLNGAQGGHDELFLSGAYGPTNAVPEPTSMILLGSGLIGAALSRRKKLI